MRESNLSGRPERVISAFSFVRAVKVTVCPFSNSCNNMCPPINPLPTQHYQWILWRLMMSVRTTCYENSTHANEKCSQRFGLIISYLQLFIFKYLLVTVGNRNHQFPLLSAFDHANSQLFVLLEMPHGAIKPSSQVIDLDKRSIHCVCRTVEKSIGAFNERNKVKSEARLGRRPMGLIEKHGS